MLENVIGLSLVETLLALGLLLFVVDFFFQSDLPTLIGYGFVAAAVGLMIDVHWLYRASLILGVFVLLSIFHYTLWKTVVSKVVDRYVSPKSFSDINERLIGAEGIIRRIDGETLVEVNAELWPVVEPTNHVDGTAVIVIARTSSRLVVGSLPE